MVRVLLNVPKRVKRDEPFDVVGELEVTMPMERQEEALDELMRRAARLHSDLVIGIHYEHGDGPESSQIHLRGRAIRYRHGWGGLGASP